MTVADAEPPEECVARSMLVHHAPDFPWYPLRSQLCGYFRTSTGTEPFYREVAAPIPGGIGGQPQPGGDPNPPPVPGPPDGDFSDEMTGDELILFAAEKRKTLQANWDYLVGAYRFMHQASLKLHGASALLPKLVK